MNPTNTELLEADVRAAKELGMTYGKYKAMTYNSPGIITPKKTRKRPQRTKKYTDEAVFLLWQSGKTDAEIGAAVGVSRAIIQRWRDVLELPSTTTHYVETQKYHLEKNPDGTYVAIKEDSKV